jgi:hypothetical protein
VAGVAYDVAPGVQVSIGRLSDRDGMETGGIETGVMETGLIDTGVIEMLTSLRGEGATLVATEDVLLGFSAVQASSNEKPSSEVDSLMVGQKII